KRRKRAECPVPWQLQMCAGRPWHGARASGAYAKSERLDSQIHGPARRCLLLAGWLAIVLRRLLVLRSCWLLALRNRWLAILRWYPDFVWMVDRLDVIASQQPLQQRRLVLPQMQ